VEDGLEEEDVADGAARSERSSRGEVRSGQYIMLRTSPGRSEKPSAHFSTTEDAIFFNSAISLFDFP